MGNSVAKNNSDTINWNNVNTDKFSPTFNNKYLSADSKLLYDRLTLNLPEIEITESEQDIDKSIFAKYTSTINPPNTNELSDTSPFISSEMYNYLMNQDGGAKKRSGRRHKKQRGGNDKVDQDDSSTSSTSSSSSSDDKKKKKASESESDNVSEDLSYVSSSAHTEAKDSESEQSGGYETTSVSNNNSELPPSSINTSDINMVSESS